MRRPPHNQIDAETAAALADALEMLDADDACRAVALTSEGSVFCAGANLAAMPELVGVPDFAPIYREAMRLLRTRKTIVAAVQGPAIGAGAGLALVADFRVSRPGRADSA